MTDPDPPITPPLGADRTIAILYQAIAVCRGMLYSARTGDASQGEIERILDGTSHETLKRLMGEEEARRVMHLAEALPPEDRDTLLSIKDEPYSAGVPAKPDAEKLRLVMECLISARFSADEEKWLFDAGKAASRDPSWSDYIYWPDRYGLDGSVDAAVAKAMAYQPIVLPDEAR